MTIESRYNPLGSNVVFKENFESASYTQKNGGTPTDVSYSKGVGSFNGSSSYVDTNNTFEGIFRDSFSIELKVKPLDGQPSVNETFFGMVDSGITNRVDVRLNAIGTIQFVYESNNNLAFLSSTPLSDGQQDWIHVIAVADSTIAGAGGLKLYINGSEDGTANTSSVVFADFVNSLSPFMGAINNNGSAGALYNGDIDYVNIYNKALTAEEVSNIYNKTQYKGLVTDGLVFNMDARTTNFTDKISGVSPTNTNVTLKKTEKGYAGYFDSTASLNFGNIEYLNFGTTFSLAVAFKNNKAGLSTIEHIFSKYNTASKRQWAIYVDASEKLGFLSSNNGITASSWLSTNALEVNLWNSVVITYSSGIGNVYINTNYDSGVGSFATSIFSSAADALIGNYDGGSVEWDGNILKARAYNKVLSLEEIAQLHQEFLSSQ